MVLYGIIGRLVAMNTSGIATLFQCAICYDNVCDSVYIGCKHAFCGECIRNINSCPKCRRFSKKLIRLFFYTFSDFKRRIYDIKSIEMA